MVGLQVWYSVVIVAIYGTIAATASVSSSSPSQDLTIGLVGQQRGSQARAGIDDALDDINNNTELLSGYKLKYLQHAPPSSVITSEVIIRI